MRVSRRNESFQITVNNRELKKVDHFKYLESVLRDGYSPREIKIRIAMKKKAFKRKMSLLANKLNTELSKKLTRCYISSIALHGSKTCTPR